jgi:transcriptional regulator with XRE-family HTH domain
MSRPFSRIVSALPARRRQHRKDIQEIRQEVKGLRELRLIAGKAQADVAMALRIKQPSVSKVENQTDMYLSTLRAYVEAIGGKLELVVRLPERPMTRLYRLSDALGQASPPSRSGASVRRRSAAAAGRGTPGR